MRVLCVDDDRINTLLLEHVCRAAGVLEVEFAESGAEAVRLAAEWQPQLLVVDLHLPDTDGLALLPRLREAAGRPDLHAVLCTAELPEDVAARAHAAGFNDCWTKPVVLEELQSALRLLLAASRPDATP
jgi:CheY-like chemotaxis protein